QRGVHSFPNTTLFRSSKDLNDEDLAEVRPSSKAISLPTIGKSKAKEQQKPTASSKHPKQGKTSRAVAVAKPRKTALPAKRNGKEDRKSTRLNSSHVKI